MGLLSLLLLLSCLVATQLVVRGLQQEQQQQQHHLQPITWATVAHLRRHGRIAHLPESTGQRQVHVNVDTDKWQGL